MIFSNEGVQKFKLSEGFLAEYVSKPVPWGFGVLSYIVYKRTYARPVEGENRTEEWWETCRRVIEGMYTVQKIHCRNLGLHWDNRKAQGSAREAYDRLFNLLWTPPGRGLWCMGADFIYERGSAALNNCAFTSTENLQEDPAEPFRWLFNMSMYGVGVGFDVLGKDKVKVIEPKVSDEVYVVADTKEGWGDAIYTLISAYTGRCALPREWDFTKIRAEGTPLKTFGGIAPGPQPLIDCLRDIESVLRARVGQKIQEEDIVDIANLCGRAVVSGGVRRSSEIALGKTDNFASLKRDQEKLSAWRWASNNSIVVEDGDVVDYEKHCENIAVNGEPGFFWLDNSRNYGRMKDPKNQKDYRAKGTNPCSEQTLEDHELCCLVESYPARHSSLEDFKRTMKFAYLYAKTVTLIPTHDPKTNAVMQRNNRIGASMSGIVQNIYKIGLENHIKWCDETYNYIQDLDKIYSEWLCRPRSIKTTSVKPSGTVSLLSGASPGIHHFYGQYMIRRVEISASQDIWRKAQEAGYVVEDSAYKGSSTKVVEVPIYDEYMPRTAGDVTMWEQMSLLAIHQKYWADNQVSITVTFKDHEAKDIPMALRMYADQIKSVSFLPYSDHGYVQAPYEPISKEVYEERIANIREIDWSNSAITHDQDDKFCDGEACLIPQK